MAETPNNGLPTFKARPDVQVGAVDIEYPDGTRIECMVEGASLTIFETHLSQRARDFAMAAVQVSS